MSKDRPYKFPDHPSFNPLFFSRNWEDKIVYHSEDYHELLLTILKHVANFLAAMPYEWGTGVAETKNDKWLERAVTIFKILRKKKLKIATIPFYAESIYEVLETIATIRKNKRSRFEIDVTNLFKYVKAQLYKELHEMKKHTLIHTPPSEERHIYVLEVTGVIKDYDLFLNESGENTSLNKMRVLLKNIKFYSSFLPEYLLEKLNIISPNPCPLSKSPDQFSSWRVAGIYFKETEKMRNVFVNQKDMDPRQVKAIAERIENLYQKMIDFLEWLKEELFRVIVLVHGEKFSQYIHLREE